MLYEVLAWLLWPGLLLLAIVSSSITAVLTIAYVVKVVCRRTHPLRVGREPGSGGSSRAT